MESLPPKTQEQIKKMSAEYLVLKLTKAGVDEETILKMSRDQLMAAWAELVATGKDKPAAAGFRYCSVSSFWSRIGEAASRFRNAKIWRESWTHTAIEAKADAERLRQKEKAEAERIRMAEERHLQQIQLEWRKN